MSSGQHVDEQVTIATIETPVHGRHYLLDRGSENLLVGFHGYAQTGGVMLRELQTIPGGDRWSLASIEALHPFYTRQYQSVVANWMTRQDRELAIADNLEYVRRTITALPPHRRIVLLGFSQGASMAARAAALVTTASGLILLGGDIPPEIKADTAASMPPTLLARGERDTWYTDEKLKNDFSYLATRCKVSSCVFAGGHEWADEFRRAAGAFLDGLLESGTTG